MSTEKKQPNAWILHCKNYQLENKCSYKEAIKLAKDTYVRTEKPTKEVTIHDRVAKNIKKLKALLKEPIEPIEPISKIIVKKEKSKKVVVEQEIIPKKVRKSKKSSIELVDEDKE